MRLLFRILPVALLVLIAAGLIAGQSLPEERVIARSIVIEAAPARVFERVGRIRGWQGWYVAPDAEARFEGPEGAGGALVVADETSGEERRLVLTETSSPSLAVYAFPSVEGMPFEIEGRIEVEADPAGSRVTSSQRLLAQSSGFMIRAGERWFLAALAPNLIGSILERELHNLTGAVEGLPPPGSARPGAQ